MTTAASGQNIGSMADPQTEIELPTLNDEETALLRQAHMRGAYIADIKIDSRVFTLATFSQRDSEEYASRSSLIRMKVRSVLEAMAKEAGLKAEHVNRDEVVMSSQPKITAVWVAMHIRAIDGESLAFDEALAFINSGDTTTVASINVGINEIYIQYEALVVKAKAVRANLKK